MAVQRVKYRVQQGGHAIPEATIWRRYAAGLKNLLQHYLPAVDTALITDNSNTPIGNEEQIIAKKLADGALHITNAAIWQNILDIAAKA